MFPFTFSKTIEIPVLGDNVEGISKTILRTIEGYIKAEEPNSISSSEYQIIFSDSVPPVRFIMKWNLLRLIDRGVIEIVPENHKLLISYKLWFTGLFTSSLFLTTAFTICISSSGFMTSNLAIALGLGLCYFVYNYIRTVVGFYDLIRVASVI